ncbi:MAG: hypothetical protein NT154_26720 [Verrucomicrobia bacterium]|nr:hypothetical protein [Verrucomicrobiota bacterium]
MNASDESSMVERSTTVRFFRWLATWQAQRRILIGLAWLAALIALFHGEETWRGRRAWNEYRRTLEARGEPLDIKAVIPKPVPDEQNFAATPVIKSWFEKQSAPDLERRWDDDYSQLVERIHPPKTKDAKASRRLTDLAGWEMALAALRSGERVGQDDFYSAKLDADSRAKAAPAVLESLKTNEMLLAELRLASGRPSARYPVHYDVEMPFAIQFPHLSMVKGVCQRLQLRACAELAAGQSEKALEDVRLLLYVADSLKAEPFLISHLVRLAGVQLGMQPIWEGLAEHRWSEAQLQELETRLQQYKFLADMKTALASEQAAGISTIELVRNKGLWYINEIGSPDPAPSSRESILATVLGAVLVPKGWYYQEELNYSRGFHIQLATGLDATNNWVSPGQVKANARAFEQMIFGESSKLGKLGAFLNHRVMASMLLPALGRVIQKSAAAQTVVNQAAIACALERYRLANGQFPESLEALAPQFISALPKDALTGQSYKYRRKDDGRFVLYSIGWDEKDDGGISGKTMFDEKQGDWVWEYPEVQSPKSKV